VADDFDKIRRGNCTLYIHRNFRNEELEEALTAGKEKLQQLYKPTAVESSKFARVYQFTAKLNNTERTVYFKQYLSRSAIDLIKHLLRPSRAKRAFNATQMLKENGFEAPAIIAMGERKSGPFNTDNFLLTLEVENAKRIYEIIPNSVSNLTAEQMRDKREWLRVLGRTVGRIHKAGIFHGDMRLGNVLGRKNKDGRQFFFLDNERTKKFRRLPFRLRVRNLVQLNMYRTKAVTDSDRMRFFKEYRAENKNSKSGEIRLIKKVVKITNRRLEKKCKKLGLNRFDKLTTGWV
jgi:tRNA A-37 threonylcarbamoyl transferase component Bud32